MYIQQKPQLPEGRETSLMSHDHLMVALDSQANRELVAHLTDSELIALTLANAAKFADDGGAEVLVRIMAEETEVATGIPFVFSFTLSIKDGQITVQNQTDDSMGFWETEKVDEDALYAWKDLRDAKLPALSDEEHGLRQFLANLLIAGGVEIPQA